jgi:hypothetical protein
LSGEISLDVHAPATALRYLDCGGNMLIILRIVRLPARQDDEPSYRAEFGQERLRHWGFTGTVCDSLFHLGFVAAES